MTRKHFFWLRYPDPRSLIISDRSSEFLDSPKEDRIELALEHEPLPTMPLEHYLKARGLSIRKIHMVRLHDMYPVHRWYVPQSGDVIRCTGGSANEEVS